MSQEAFAPKIYVIRNGPVVLDSDLASLYGVTTGNFNKAINRNKHRFPSDFSFVLTRKKFADLIFQIGTSKRRGGQRTVPRVFTERGSIMTATVLNSQRAVAMSVYVVRAFVKMRRELLADATLEARLERIEKTHDTALRDVYQKLKPLLLHRPKSQNVESDFIPRKIMISVNDAYPCFLKRATMPEMASAATPIATKVRCSLAHNCGLQSFARASKAPCAP
jgi:phage regulator Rha-like protein